MTSPKPPVYMYVPFGDTGPTGAQAGAPGLDSSSRFIPPSDLPTPPYAAGNRLGALKENLQGDLISAKARKMLRERKETAETDYASRMAGAEERRQQFLDKRVAKASAEIKKVNEVAERAAAARGDRALETTVDIQDNTTPYFNDSILRAEAAADRRQRALDDASIPAGVDFDQAMQVRDRVAKVWSLEDEHRRLLSAEEEARRAARLQEQAAIFKEEEERLIKMYQEAGPASPPAAPSGMSYEA